MAIEARNRPIRDWFTRVRTGQTQLPRFQRREAWSYGEVESLLESVLQDFPVGSALTLDIGDTPPFISKPISGVPNPTERVTEHLLDGQQRITALWRSLKDNYPDRKYFLKRSSEGNHNWEVESISRAVRNGQRYPLWADDPKEQHSRNYIPLSILDPDNEAGVRNWCAAVDAERDLEIEIMGLKTQIGSFNFPFIGLGVTTPGHVAIEVFIKLNTNQEELTKFDIVVAQFEDKTGKSLHDYEEDINSSIPAVKQYMPAGELALRIAALREGRVDNQASYLMLDLEKLDSEWSAICKGIAGVTSFLKEEGILDKHRLPTIPVVPVIGALWADMPDTGDELGRARTLLQQYLWRSFFTKRYDKAAGSRALQDYLGLRQAMISGGVNTAPIFDDAEFPLTNIEGIKMAGWPKRRDTLARGILAISLKGGGHDIADGSPVSQENLGNREYHHLFPVALIGEESDPNLALNCALFTWKTNRTISAKSPIKYLRERTTNAQLGEEQVINRLKTHAIPYAPLNVGDHSDLSEEDRASAIREDYQKFLDARAEWVYAAAQSLSNGGGLPGAPSA